MNIAAPPQIFSQPRRAAKWARLIRRASMPGAADYLLKDAIDDVIERLDFMRLQPRSALIIGDWSGSLAKELEARGTQVHNYGVGEIDEEQPLTTMGHDLIVHLLALGSVNDLPGAFIHSRAALATGGVMIAAFPGAGSLAKTRKIMLAADAEKPSGRIHPMVDQHASVALLDRAGFRRQVVDSHTLTVRFSSFAGLVHDLRDHGLNNALIDHAPHLVRSSLERANAAFTDLADPDGKVAETFEMLVLTGWK